jgi:iron complex transport system substrate-binding protein
LSADLAAHLKLEESLIQAKLDYGYFRIDTFGDYKAFMGQFCALSGRDDLFSKNVLETEKRINTIRQKIPENNSQTVLLLRVYSTGMKAKSDDNIAGLILKEFGLKNLADIHPSMLEDISLEQIVTDDPDFIFASTMGSVKDAEKYLENNITSNPAWEELTAIKNNRYVVLPKELFHYKPNEKWDKAYEFIAKLIFPEIFGQ